MQYINKATSFTKKIKNIPVSSINSKITSMFKKSSTQQQQTSLQQKITSLLKEKQSILSTSKMQQIANYSYCEENFYIINDILHQQLSLTDFQFTKRKSRKIRNILIVMGYLLRHGVGGFIDQFRNDLDTLKQLEQLQMKNGSTSQQYISKIKKDKKLLNLIQQIKQRAHYIIDLLTDKAKMLKEKQLANLIKQKMQQHFIQKQKQIQNISKIRDQGMKKQAKQQGLSLSIQHSQKIHRTKMQKAQDFLNNYLFKYLSKADQKLDAISDAILMKIDQFLVGDLPQQFQIDQIQDARKSQHNLPDIQKRIEEQRQFVNNRINKQQKKQLSQKKEQICLLTFEKETEPQNEENLIQINTQK